MCKTCRTGKIAAIAQSATFYKPSSSSVMFRIEYAGNDEDDDGSFSILDEDSGDQSIIQYSDVPKGAVFKVLHDEEISF